MLVALFGFTPTLRKQIAALDKDGADSSEFRRLGNRNRLLGIFLAIVVVAIVFCMVVKPT